MVGKQKTIRRCVACSVVDCGYKHAALTLCRNAAPKGYDAKTKPKEAIGRCQTGHLICALVGPD